MSYLELGCCLLRRELAVILEELNYQCSLLLAELSILPIVFSRSLGGKSVRAFSEF